MVSPEIFVLLLLVFLSIAHFNFSWLVVLNPLNTKNALPCDIYLNANNLLIWGVFHVERKLKMKAQAYPRGAFILSPESGELKHFMNPHPTTAKADGGHKIENDRLRYTFTTLPALGCRIGLLRESPVRGKWTPHR